MPTAHAEVEGYFTTEEGVIPTRYKGLNTAIKVMEFPLKISKNSRGKRTFRFYRSDYSKSLD